MTTEKMVKVELADIRQKVAGVQYEGGETITVPEHVGKRLEDPKREVDGLRLGTVLGPAEGEDPLAGVSFASPTAESEARDAELSASDFADVEAEGESGYTAEQVRTLASG